MNEPSPLARDLVNEKWGAFFLYPSHTEAIEAIWQIEANHAALIDLVKDARQPLKARLFACEVLFAKNIFFMAETGKEPVAEIYTQSLAQDVIGFANPWGFLYEHQDDGTAGVRFLMLGETAVPGLTALLDNTKAGPVYMGSKEAMVGNGYHFRICDFAAWYLGRIKGLELKYFEQVEDRDRQIEELKLRLGE